VDDPHHIEELALVFMNPLYMNVKQRFRIDGNPGSRTRNSREPVLIGLLDGAELFLKGCVASVRLELVDLREVPDPTCTDPAGDELG